MRSDISRVEWIDCLQRLRDARALVLQDAESFQKAAIVLEVVGQRLSGEVRDGLNHYRAELIELGCAGSAEKRDDLVRLFEVVREARNTAVHVGAWARHLNSRLTDFVLQLEESIMNHLLTAGDIMVRDVVVAEPWHMLGHVRREMLANSFSSLPYLHEGEWFLLLDNHVMRYLRAAGSPKEKKLRLAAKAGNLIADNKLAIVKATTIQSDMSVVELTRSEEAFPVLVVEPAKAGPRLLGLITAFDLL